MRPAAHDSAGRTLGQQVLPRDTNGVLDLNRGKIVLLSIGMSNTTQEFSTFKPLADTDPAKNPKLVLVDGAQGGKSANVIVNESDNFWTIVDQRLTSAQVSRKQVQVAWVKEADPGPTQAFPVHAQTLQRELETIARILKSRFPNIRIAYYSSRIYAGYASSNLNPEPYAYESGFSVKWMIEKQINGDTSLAYAGPNARVPWLGWGPYLWADGLIARNDGLTWECADYSTSDGTHPATGARQKVSQLLLSFLKSDPTAIPWFLASPVTSTEEAGSVVALDFRLEQNYPNPFSAKGGSDSGGNPRTSFEFRVPRFELVSLKVFDLLGRETATIVNDELQPGVYKVQWDARDLPSGVYIYRMHAGEFVATRQFVLLK